MSKQFLFLEPWGGSPPEHWQSWLASELKVQHKKILFPRLPSPDYPDFDVWMEHLRSELSGVDLSETTILCHSLGCTLWLHFAKKHPGLIPYKVYLVAPALVGDIKETLSFFPLPEFESESKNSEYIIVCSENDQYTPFETFQSFAETNHMDLILLPGQGHINTAAGYGKWPWILEECLKG